MGSVEGATMIDWPIVALVAVALAALLWDGWSV